MRRSKLVLIPAFLIAVLFLATDDTQGQGPGGGGGFGGFGGGGGGKGGFGGGGGGRNPDDGFNRMLQSYGGSGDVLDYSKLSPEYRERTNSFLQRMNQPPLPTSGTLTRQQYRVEQEQKMAAFQGQFGGGKGGFGGAPGGGGLGGGTPGGFGGQPGGGFGSKDGGRGGFGATPGGGFGAPTPAPGAPGQPMVMQLGAPGGPQQPNAMSSDEGVRMMMARRDRDQDGRISFEEAQSSDALRGAFQQYDTNRDGFLDVNEYRPFLEVAMAGRNNGGGNNNERGGRDQMNQFNQQQWNQGQGGGNFPPPWGGSQGGPGEERRDRRGQEDPAEARPEVYGYGKQPKGAPAYFDTLDLDKDGQLALYEWRKDTNRTIAQFAELDLNDDGYLTGVEWLRAQELQIARRSAPRGEGEERARPSMGGGGGGAPSMGGGNAGGGGRPNPFTSGAGGPPPGGQTRTFTFGTPPQGGSQSKDGKDRTNGKGGPTRGKEEPKREGKSGRE